MIDDPSVTPVSPGQAVVRLTEVGGAIMRHHHIASALPEETAQNLRTQRERLLAAVESGGRGAIQAELRDAQETLRRLYETVSQPGLWGAEQAPGVFAALKFPDPLQPGLQTIDVTTVVATFTQPARQVLTTLSFDDAAGATAYWLRETRVIQNEEAEDHLLESYAPLFTRVRLPASIHRFRIESRNPHEFAVSEEFQIEVPPGKD